MGIPTRQSKGNPSGIFPAKAYHLGMIKPQTNWAYHPSFCEAVRELRLKHGITLSESAKKLGLELATLHDYLYKKHMRPGRQPLKLLCMETGRRMADFGEDPTYTPEGATPAMPEAQKYILHVIGKDLGRLTELQRQNVFDAWRAMVRSLENSTTQKAI
jgi:transcriptional regulator with XRE-family HTH domain